ncbi:MAG: PTS sugar transporter subunit IIA [Faecalibacterium prausnitzii]
MQYNAEDDGNTDSAVCHCGPGNGSLHVDMLARMMQMLMNEDFVEKLKAAKDPARVPCTHRCTGGGSVRRGELHPAGTSPRAATAFWP